MKHRYPPSITAWMLFPILLFACSSHRAVTATGVPSLAMEQGNVPAGGGSHGQTVTKEVPYSKESVSDIKEREAKDPLPPRGDTVIPLHRKPGGDNGALPSPTVPGPGRMDPPSCADPDETGGTR